MVALIVGDVHGARGGSECKRIAGRINREGVAIDDVVGVLLRQAVGERREGLTAVASARDHELAADGDTALVLDRGDEPRRFRLGRVDGDREAEYGRSDVRDFGP